MRIGILLLLFCVVIINPLFGQVTILPGESSNIADPQVFHGDYNQGYNNCNFIKGKGMLSVGFQVQKEGVDTWNEIYIAFQYGGVWYRVCDFYADNHNFFYTYGYPNEWYQLDHSDGNKTHVFYNQYQYYNYLPANNIYPSQFSRTKVTESYCGSTATSNWGLSIYLANNGVLKRYNGNYLPVGGDINYRNTPADNANFSIQTRPYSNTYVFPVSNPLQSTGDLAVSTGWSGSYWNSISVGNLPGVAMIRRDLSNSSIVVNLTNLPPEMLESPSFKVHVYGKSITGNHNRIYETVYNNPNFMNIAPVGLTASKDLCGKVKLNWGNSGANVLPVDGNVNLKYVIFRDGAYLATVAGNVTSYEDLTAVQDVEYDYSIRHVAFSESGDTYFRSPASTAVRGSVKPSPEVPHSVSATSDKCDGSIQLSWVYNGQDPDKFKIEFRDSPTQPFVALPNVSGGNRGYLHTGLVRGKEYSYQIYSVSTCSVLSTSSGNTAGISPSDPLPATNIVATPNSASNSITVSWLDNATNESKYELIRTDDDGNTMLNELNANVSVFTDNSVTACRNYTYKVKAYNGCVLNGVLSASSVQTALPPPNLNNTFDATHKIVGTKGYFANRIELNWSNNNEANLDFFKIYRKQIGTNLDSVQIASLPSGTAFYVDATADARTFYRYSIVGLKKCNGSEILTNVSSDVGFRIPAGLVSGHIAYAGGVDVGGVKVLIESSSSIKGQSIHIRPGGSVVIKDDPKLEPGSQLRCEFWLNFSTLTNADIVNKPNAFRILTDLNANVIKAGIFVGGSFKFVSVPLSHLGTAKWSHFAMVYDGTKLKAFVNGVLKASTPVTGSVDDNFNNLQISSPNSSMDFYLDEFRLLGQAATDSVIALEYGRILSGAESNFKCNLHFNEGFGNAGYDISKTGNAFNANHAYFSGDVTWSANIPTASQLGYFGVTNALGNYSVPGIQYTGNGESFSVTPQFETHSFSPNSRSVYIGDASYIYNDLDFTDISSFPFSGTLFYKGTTCPVPGAGLRIDGQPVVLNGSQAVTDELGKFSISVPIGKHYVSVEKFAHNMELGRYPTTGTFNFQAPVSGVSFVDSTTVKVIGRVVGGTVESEKQPGMGRSKNNIGQAKITFATPLTGSPCFVKSIVTDLSTGEYEVNLPPMVYKIDSAYVVNNKIGISKSNLSNTNQLLDLTTEFASETARDTLRDNFGGIVSIDSVVYNKRLDFVYRTTPLIEVLSKDGDKLHGEDTLYSGNTAVVVKPLLNPGAFGWGPYNWPLFKQGKTYSLRVRANEVYSNADNGVKDTVPLSGTVRITNQLVDGSDPNANLNFVNGKVNYSFVCGSPNLSTIAGTPDLSYTRDIQIAVVPEGAATVNWFPNAQVSPGNPNFHAYTLGQRITGTGVATQGPEKVDFILRDPPGSGSSATWSSSSSLTKETSVKTNFSSATGIETSILLGHREIDGLGVAITVEQDNNLTLGLDVTTSFDRQNSMVETISTSYNVSTRDDPDNVGSDGDVFVGRSRNWLMGPTGNVVMMDTAKCFGRCFGAVVNGKQLAKTVGFAIAPNGVRTRFSYTQSEIEQNVIPGLIALRDFILTNKPDYTPLAPSTHPLFGSNNDDPAWGAQVSTVTPEVYDPADTLGQSYIYRGFKAGKSDTVRILNSQIALWKRALARNEREKYLAKTTTNTPVLVANPNYPDNPFTEPPFITVYPPIFQDNYTVGTAVVTNSYQVDDEEAYSEVYEVAVEQSLTTTLGVSIAGAGFEASPHVSFSEGLETSKSTVNTSSNAIEYTLTDGDPGDFMSVDVYRYGLSNIFITRGGQTMCPYEDALVFHYFDPGNPNAFIGSHSYNADGYYTISNATVQREMPSISISPAIQYNIPSDQAAVFQLNLSNQSPLTVNNDLDMQIRVASSSNPNGAIVKIDGQNANSVFNIPGGGSVLKTLTVERGPSEIEYDSLMIVFSSACSDDISDTAYISVHFIPTCTPLSISTPVNDFVVNNASNAKVGVVIEDYNYNFGTVTNNDPLTGAAHPAYGLEKIGLEFKPVNSSQWIQVQEFFKYPYATGADSLFPIPVGQAYIQYIWNVSPQAYADGNYEIRAVSYCYNKDGSYAKIYSPVNRGVMDRINPEPFGVPTPGDGILDADENISIQFNEAIDVSSLSYAPSSNPNSNFDIRGVLNGTAIRHSESLSFNGTSDYAVVAGGVNLQKRSFTLEFWAKVGGLNRNQVLISQGADLQQVFLIGFDNSNKLRFKLGSREFLTTNPILLPADWHHYAVVFDYTNTDAMIYVDGVLSGYDSQFAVDYLGTGKLYFGKTEFASSDYFSGNMHDVRLWNEVRTNGEITVTMNKVLNQNQVGLVYNWRMDEANGDKLTDVIRSRNASVYGATWEINPNGSAVEFDGVDDVLAVATGVVPINKETNFTMEFWFSSVQSGSAVLVSNGRADGLASDSLTSWNIAKDGAGKIHVLHNGLDFIATDSNYFDGQWHHFALVMDRRANLTCFVDGDLQKSVHGNLFNDLSGSSLYLGARGYFTGTISNYDSFFEGKLDEFRLWNSARKVEQLLRDKQHRLLGDEHGLEVYLPFERYANVLGTPVLTPDYSEQGIWSLAVNPLNALQLVNKTPTIKLPRPVQHVAYNYSLNNDRIILSPAISPELIEDVSLDVTVKNVYDLHGNKMISPETWTAFVDKNQVKWQDVQFNVEKTTDSTVSFTAQFFNRGGEQKEFLISGLPQWLQCDVTDGVILANSSRTVLFTIPAGQAVGEYTANISLTTDFNYAELLQLDVKVLGKIPDWNLNVAAFQNQMSMFAQVKIDNVISTHEETRVAAFCNGEIRGLAKLQYVPAYDRYEAFMNIYSNSTYGDSIYFNIYDGNTGLVYVKVDTSLVFADNSLVGTVSNPATLSASTEVVLEIPLNVGWNWVSFPLKSSSLQSGNSLFYSLTSTNGDIASGIGAFDQYDSSMGWLGNITQSGGYQNNQSYKLKTAQPSTLVHTGLRLHPDSSEAAIVVAKGWNWIGYVSSRELSVTEAMSAFNATTGDLLKSQNGFAYYDSLTGWTGSLTYLKPGVGYMLRSSSAAVFNYPPSSYAGKLTSVASSNIRKPEYLVLNPGDYEFTMSVIAQGNLCEEVLFGETVMLAAFDKQNRVRGYVYPIKTGNRYLYYLTLYGNAAGELIDLKYIDSNTGKMLATDSEINFIPDALMGNNVEPMQAVVEPRFACSFSEVTQLVQLENNNTNCRVSPNPFEDRISIQFAVPSKVYVELVDVVGKVLIKRDSGNLPVSTMEILLPESFNLTSGMYFLRVNGETLTNLKLMKIK